MTVSDSISLNPLMQLLSSLRNRSRIAGCVVTVALAYISGLGNVRKCSPVSRNWSSQNSTLIVNVNYSVRVFVEIWEKYKDLTDLLHVAIYIKIRFTFFLLLVFFKCEDSRVHSYRIKTTKVTV